MLTSLFFQAFHDTIEYCDYSNRKIRDSAINSLATFFGGKRGEPHPVSRVAAPLGRLNRQEIIGAALFVAAEAEPTLDMLFVSPHWRRKGVASTLVGGAINELHRLGIRTLKSAYVMGNEESQAWHERFGFEEEPDLLSAQLYYRHAQHELARHQTLRHLSGPALARLERHCAHWKQEVGRLEAVVRQQGYEAVCPILRRTDHKSTSIPSE